MTLMPASKVKFNDIKLKLAFTLTRLPNMNFVILVVCKLEIIIFGHNWSCVEKLDFENNVGIKGLTEN